MCAKMQGVPVPFKRKVLQFVSRFQVNTASGGRIQYKISRDTESQNRSQIMTKKAKLLEL